MIRCTTSLQEFSLPIDPSTVKDLALSYSQDRAVVLRKLKADMDLANGVWSIVLSPSETAKFKPGIAIAQVHFITTSGQRYSTNREAVGVEDTNDEEAFV